MLSLFSFDCNKGSFIVIKIRSCSEFDSCVVYKLVSAGALASIFTPEKVQAQNKENFFLVTNIVQYKSTVIQFSFSIVVHENFNWDLLSQDFKYCASA